MNSTIIYMIILIISIAISYLAAQWYIAKEDKNKTLIKIYKPPVIILSVLNIILFFLYFSSKK